MKNLGYRLLKLWVKSGLYLYYGRIKISGLENVPQNKPVLFLPNHQAALMDVLLIVTDCRRKPFFLTRSDVFGNPTLKKFFTYLRMIPIYRIRDGRESLKKNQAVFDQCARLFQGNQAIVLFPEGSHNIKRRVRPLSKGFTRILFKTLESRPEPEIHLIPVGLNYVKNDGFPDRVALNYGKNIVVNGLYDPEDVKGSVSNTKNAVSEGLQVLTTHIGDEKDYDAIAKKLDALQVDYLNPSETNAAIGKWKLSDGKTTRPSSPQMPFTSGSPIEAAGKNAGSPRPTVLKSLSKSIFTLLNFPVIALWRTWIKPKVWEPEFTATLRFGFAMVAYPIYYLGLFLILAAVCNGAIAFTVVVALFIFNWMYVRFQVT